MANSKLSTKHIQIDKANQAVIIAVAAATVISVFGIFISKAMLARQGHQSRVITEKEKAVKQLKVNIDAKNSLIEQYKQFVNTETNLLGGSSSQAATGEKDGDNARLILDALPSVYDYPALATSIDNLFKTNGFTLDNIEGSDDEVANTAVDSSSNPETVEIPFGVTIVGTDYNGIQKVVSLLESSIRPMKIDELSISGGDNAMSIKVSLKTFYLPPKTLNITLKEIK